MLQDIDTQTITVTPAASQAVQNILAEKKLEGYALRLYVAGGSCCGVNFGMALENNIRENDDLTFESNGIKLVIDKSSMEFLEGATVDFVNDPNQGQGFAVHSPSAARNREGGDCGGSCSCGN